MFPSLPHDYIHRRRVIRRIATVFLVLVLSVLVAYVIVHASAGAPAFSPPHP